MEEYKDMIQEWVKAYKYCLTYEQLISMGLVEDDEIEEYLQEKARLIICAGNLFIVKCAEDKGKFDKEYIAELFEGLKEELAKEDVKLTDFDDQYISDMLNEMEKDYIEAKKEAEESKEVSEE